MVSCKKIKAALPILENPKGKRDLLHMMCDQWGQEQWRNNKHLPAPVLAQELTAKVLAASNVALRRWEKSGSAAQPVAPSDVAQLAHDDEMPNAAPSSAAEPAAASSAAQLAHDDHASSKCTSLAVVEEWLGSLQDIAEKEEVRKIHLALEFLNKPAARKIKNICAVWPEQKQKKNGKVLTLKEFVAELSEKVLATSNAMKARREQMERTAHIGAAQPAHHTDVLADADEHTMETARNSRTSREAIDDEMDSSSAPPGKRLRATDEQSSKRKTSGQEAVVRDTKQRRLTAFFSTPSAASASGGEQRGQATATTSTDENIDACRGATSDTEPRRKQKEMSRLSRELVKYRKENAGPLDFEIEIKQSQRLRNWPPARSMLEAREVQSLYAKALGQRQHEKYVPDDYNMLYACACDKLEFGLSEKLLKAEPIAADGYPAMAQLQGLLQEEAPLTLSKNAIGDSMAQPPVLNSLPFNILKGLPREKLRFLGPDIFFVVQMLVCVEIPGAKLEDLPSPLHTADLIQKVHLHRQRYLQDSDEQGFTKDDVKAILRDFAGRHSSRARWLREIIGLKRNAPLEERLVEVTDTFFENVTVNPVGYTPACVAVAVLVYHLAPKINVRKGPMLLSPAARLVTNRPGEAGTIYCAAEARGNEVVRTANHMPACGRRRMSEPKPCAIAAQPASARPQAGPGFANGALHSCSLSHASPWRWSM